MTDEDSLVKGIDVPTLTEEIGHVIKRSGRPDQGHWRGLHRKVVLVDTFS